MIDKVSMLSCLPLLFIHLRLTEVMYSNKLFKGVSVVFFADLSLLQLPPLKGNQAFVPVTFQEAKTRPGAIASLGIW